MSDDLQTDRAHAPRSTPRWLRALAADFIARVNDRGMTLSMPAAETLLAERISSLAGDLRISERSARAYVDHVALDGLAESLVASFHDEAPAADLFALPRTSAMGVSDYGRLVAALAECAQFFGTATQLGAEECRSRVLETAQLLALAGLMQAEHDGGNDIAAPPAMFARIERLLHTVADLTHNPALQRALVKDARLACVAAARANISAGPPGSARPKLAIVDTGREIPKDEQS